MDEEMEVKVTGVETEIKIIPDYQREELEKLADDALRLFWVSIVTMGLFIPVFAVLLKANYEIIQKILSDKYLTTGVLFAMVSMGCALFAYGYGRSKRGNSIPSRQYIEMKEKVESDLGEVKISGGRSGNTTFSNYFMNITNFNNSVKRVRIFLLLGMYTLYLSVSFLIMAVLRIFIQLPQSFIYALMGLPLLSAILLMSLISLITESPDKHYLKPIKESKKETTADKKEAN